MPNKKFERDARKLAHLNIDVGHAFADPHRILDWGEIMKLAVASCAKLQQTNPQPVWAEILMEQPDVLLLIGDNIYLDHDRHTGPSRLEKKRVTQLVQLVQLVP